jgi:WD40 repeat protein
MEDFGLNEPTIFVAHDSYVLGLLFTKDSSRMLSIGMDNVANIWSTSDWQRLNQFQGHAHSVNSMALTPDEKRLVTSSSDNTVKVWSFPDGKLLHTLQDRKKVVSAVALSPDGYWIGAVSYSGRFMVWTVGGEPVVAVKANQKNLASIAFSADGKTLAVGGLGDDITLWSLPSGEQIETLSGHKIAVSSLQFINDGQSLVSLGYDQSIIFWDTGIWKPERTVRSDTQGVRGIIFSPDEKTAALSMESKIQLWSVDEWKLAAELPISTKVASAMAYSEDGRWLAIGGADKKVRIFDNPL